MNERYVGAMIGIDKYIHWRKLENAVNDTEAITKILKDKWQFKFPFESLINEKATKSAIMSLVDDKLRSHLYGNDNLLLFYAGHGHTRIDKLFNKEIETGYIIPVEAEVKSKGKENWSQYIDLDSFLQTIAKLPAKHILVILDSCFSGFALGKAMRTFRSQYFEDQLKDHISRKIITSARRNQLAVDAGITSDHSLFAVTLMNALETDEADTDGNGLITSSDLGNYLMNKVGMNSDSQQIPDYGSFDLDDRGEMIFDLHKEGFELMIKDAYEMLTEYNLIKLRKIILKLLSHGQINSDILYLKYRDSLFQNKFYEAYVTVGEIMENWTEMKDKSFRWHDFFTIRGQLSFLRPFLKANTKEFPVNIKMYVQKHKNNLKLSLQKQEEYIELRKESIGEITGFRIEQGSTLHFSFTNESNQTIFLYPIEIDNLGHFLIGPIWVDKATRANGFEPKKTIISNNFSMTGDSGLYEILFLSSPRAVSSLDSPPYFGVKGSDFSYMGTETEDIIDDTTLKKMMYVIFKS